MFIKLMGKILSQCLCHIYIYSDYIYNQYVAHFKYLTVSFVNHTSIRLEKKWGGGGGFLIPSTTSLLGRHKKVIF